MHIDRRTALVVGLTGMLGAIAPGVAQADPIIIPRDSVTYGRTYGDWAAAWWQWALSIPASHHPLFDTADCGVGQSGPVFFLGGKACSTLDTHCDFGHADRICTVPSGKALFFPVINTEDSTLEESQTASRTPP